MTTLVDYKSTKISEKKGKIFSGNLPELQSEFWKYVAEKQDFLEHSKDCYDKL